MTGVQTCALPISPTRDPPVCALRSCRPNTGARRKTVRVVAQAEVERLRPDNAASASTYMNHFYLRRPARFEARASMSQCHQESAASAPKPLASGSVRVKNTSMSCLPQRHSNYSRLVRGNPVEPNPSFKLSPNGGSRWPSSAGPAAHFALAVQHAPPSVPA